MKGPVSAKLKSIRTIFKEAVDAGKRSIRGRIIFTFQDIWKVFRVIVQHSRVIQNERSNPNTTENNAVSQINELPLKLGIQEEIQSEDTSAFNNFKENDKENAVIKFLTTVAT